MARMSQPLGRLGRKPHTNLSTIWLSRGRKPRVATESWCRKGLRRADLFFRHGDAEARTGGQLVHGHTLVTSMAGLRPRLPSATSLLPLHRPPPEAPQPFEAHVSRLITLISISQPHSEKSPLGTCSEQAWRPRGLHRAVRE